MKAIKTVMFFGAGQIAAFDTDGQQVSELQGSAVELWLNLAEKLGYVLDDLTVETVAGNFKPVKTESGWRPYGV